MEIPVLKRQGRLASSSCTDFVLEVLLHFYEPFFMPAARQFYAFFIYVCS